MKKILLLCDSDNFPEGALNFIVNLSGQESLMVKGMFLTPYDFDQVPAISYIPAAGPYARLKEKEKNLVLQSQNRFTELCNIYGIKHQVHSYSKEWNRDILEKESRFADLVVLSEELFCQEAPDRQPNYFMQETLRLAECPVVVVPESFRSIDRIAMAYDGKKESMFSIRLFASLFAGLSELPIDIFYIKEDESEETPDQELLREYTSAHFESQFTHNLHFDRRENLAGWLDNKKNVLLVTGSYSRSSFSNLIRKSFAKEIISNHSCPVFIAHH